MVYIWYNLCFGFLHLEKQTNITPVIVTAVWYHIAVHHNSYHELRNCIWLIISHAYKISLADISITWSINKVLSAYFE